MQPKEQPTTSTIRYLTSTRLWHGNGFSNAAKSVADATNHPHQLSVLVLRSKFFNGSDRSSFVQAVLVLQEEKDLGNEDNSTSSMQHSESSHSIPSICPGPAEGHDAEVLLAFENLGQAEVLFQEYSGHRELIVFDPSGNAEVIVCDSLSLHTDVIVCDHSGNAEVAVYDPSFSSGSDYDDDNDTAVLPQVYEDTTNVDETADSALVWGCLSALLGPKSVLQTAEKRQKKRTPVNLWQGDGDDDDNDDYDIPSIISPDDDEVEDDLLEPGLDDVHEGVADSSDNCSIPSLSPEYEQFKEDLVFNMDIPKELSLPSPVKRKSSGNGIADSTLAWSALAAILGSPAPSSAVKKSARKERLDLWEDGESDLLPEIGGLEVVYNHEGEEDSLGIPSIDLNELEDSNEDVNFCFKDPIHQNDGDKKSTGSVLAFSALGMILGSPLPKMVCKKKISATKKERLNLWEDGESDLLPEIDELEEGCDHEDEDDSLAISSIDLSELEDSNEDVNFCFKDPIHQNDGDKKSTGSALAFSALGMILGSPLPKLLTAKSSKASSAKNLWGVALDTIPSMHLNEDDMDIVPPPLAGNAPAAAEVISRPAAVAGSAKLPDEAAKIAAVAAAAKAILTARYGTAIKAHPNRDLHDAAAELRLSLPQPSLCKRGVSESALASAVTVAAAELAAAESEKALTLATASIAKPSTVAAASENLAAATHALGTATTAMTEANDAAATLTALTKASTASAGAAIENDFERNREEFRQNRLRRALRKRAVARGKLLAAAEAVMAADGVVTREDPNGPGHDNIVPEISLIIDIPNTQLINFLTPLDRSGGNTKSTDETVAAMAAEPEPNTAADTVPTTMNAAVEAETTAASVTTPVTITGTQTNPWEEAAIENYGLDIVPSMCLDEGDVDCIPSPPFGDQYDEYITSGMEEPVSTNALDDCPGIKYATNKKEISDCAIAWSLMAALLGGPAPSFLKKRQGKSFVKNLWDDGIAIDDDLNKVLPCSQCVISQDDCNGINEKDIQQLCHIGSMYGKDASGDNDDTQELSFSTTSHEYSNDIKHEDHDDSFIAQKIFIPDKPCKDDDTHSIPSLLGSSRDWYSGSFSPVSIVGSYCDLTSSPME